MKINQFLHFFSLVKLTVAWLWMISSWSMLIVPLSVDAKTLSDLPVTAKKPATPEIYSQNYRYQFTRTGLEQGLNSEYVWSLAEDDKGIVWLGGINGIEGFDGRQVLNLENELSTDSTHLPASTINALYHDTQGGMWMGLRNSVALFNPQRSDSGSKSNPGNSNETALPHIKLWQYYSDNPSASSESVISASFSHFQELPSGTMLTASAGRIFKIDRRSADLTLVVDRGADRQVVGFFNYQNKIAALFDDWQLLWISASGQPEQSQQLTPTEPYQSAGVLFKSHHNILFIAGVTKGLFSIPLAQLIKQQELTEPPKAITLSTNIGLENIMSLGEDSEDSLLIGTQQGLFRYYLKQSQPRLTPIDVNDGQVQAQYIYSIRLARDGTLLLGTDRGLYKARVSSPAINKIKMNRWYPQPDTTSLATDSLGRLWGAGSRLWRVTPSGDELPLPETIKNLRNVNHLLGDQQHIWVSHKKGISVIDSEKLTRIDFPLDPQALNCDAKQTPGAYFALKLKRDNRLAFSVNGGIAIMGIPPEGFTEQPVFRYHPLGSGCRPYSNLVESHNGQLYTSRGSEIWQLLSDGKAVGHQIPGFPYLFMFKSHLPGAHVTSKERLLVTTGTGLYQWLEDRQHLEAVKLASHNWLTVIPTEKQIWVSTLQQGIHRIDKTSGQVRYYGQQDGLLNRKYNLNAASVLPDGRLAFGGEEGIDIIDPGQMPDHEPLNLQISSIKYDMDSNRQLVLPLLARQSEQPVLLPATARNIEIWLSIANHQYADKYRFRYQLAGLSNSWQELPQGSSKFTLAALPVGQYLIDVEVSSPSGAKQRLAQPLQITIAEPSWDWWYKKAWQAGSEFFNVWISLSETAQPGTKIIYLLILVLLFVAFIFWRWQLSRQRQQALKQEIEEKTRFITEQKKELETLLHYRQDLLSNIAHELKTPLTLMLGVMSGNYSEMERQNKLKRLIFRISRLLDNMLDLSRASQQPPPADHCKNYYRSHEFVEFYATTYSGFVPSGRLVVKENQAALVQCAPDVLDKIITNLINNAIKYSPAHSSIDISASYRQNFWYFRVQNQGQGIAPELLASVFERFVQVGEAKQSFGLGLGLPLVKQLVESNGGNITINSEPNKLTICEVSLPAINNPQGDIASFGINQEDLPEEYRQWLYAELPATLPNEQQTQTVSQPTMQTVPQAHFPASAATDARQSNESLNLNDHHQLKLVFCIDDNLELLQQLREQLGNRYQLVCFSNPKEALTQAELQLPDLIISDVMMPQMSGMDLVRYIRDNELTSHIPVILLTARCDEGSKAEGLRALADDYLNKPYQPQQLCEKIDNLITIRSLLKARFTVVKASQDTSEWNKSTPLSKTHKTASKSEQENNPGSGQQKFKVLFSHAPPEQQRFMNKVIDCMQKHVSEPDFNLSKLGLTLHLSDSQVRRKIKGISGYSPQEVLRIIRLETAASQILDGESLKAVAHDCGFSSQSHMGASFKAWFGVTPSQYRLKQHEQTMPSQLDKE